MNKCFFNSFVRRRLRAYWHPMDKCGTPPQETTRWVIDNDFATGLSCVSFGNERKEYLNGCLFPASAC